MNKFEILPSCKEAVFHDEMVRIDETWGIKDRSGLDRIKSKFQTVLGVADDERSKNLSLARKENLGEEEYRIDIDAAGMAIAASTPQGFQRAYATLIQLQDGPHLPACHIHDWPRLPIRGMHLMFRCFRQMGFVEAQNLIATAARLKLNTLLMEFGDRFPFAGRHRIVASPSALTRAEITALVTQAREQGMEIIPLLQSLGHLEYLLKHDAYAEVREEDQHRAQMCPTNEKSFQIFTELAEDMLQMFGNSRFMHIGADEARQLGHCPRCKMEMQKTSKGVLYATHTNRICEWLCRKGLTPILWDDILCAHPDALEHLHPGAWIMYWDYWTTSLDNPLLVARHDRANKSHIVYDARWQTEWRNELPTVTARVLEAYGQPVRLEEDLTASFIKVYGPYLGGQFPKFVRPFPYLEYYQAKGRKVIGAPTCSGNRSSWHKLPDFPRYGENIHSFAERCIEARSAGLIATAWYNRMPEILHPGLIETAEFTW
ncbi:MAG: family 20 glycosylhydrolase [Verrucomicrobiae bacterium]|nr:family 20 glycosylhydrolase [Verrucomicrobiae bacterium]